MIAFGQRSRIAAIIVAVLASSVRLAAAQDDRPYAVVFDRYMMPATGTLDLLTLQRAETAVEDRWLPPAPFDQSTWLKRSFGIGYRFGKWFGLDLPQDHFLMVVAHEVFGHGARLREIGAGHITYGFDVPIPYGPGGAVTEFAGDVSVTRADVLAVDTAGIEAQNVLADHIGRQSLAAGALPYREAWLYFESRLAGLGYIRRVSPRSSEGNDIRAFLLDFNDECDPPVCNAITASELKRRALRMLADPMLGYAGYAWAVSYIFQGHHAFDLPMIPLPHDLRYLPALHFEMTPYGTATTTEHVFVRHGRLTSISIGIGDTGRRRAWDVGAVATDVVRLARLRGDMTVTVWQQPSLDTPPNAQLFSTGVLGAATARIPFGGGSGLGKRTGLVIQLGYKSDGFVRGERLHAGPIVRVGLTVTR